MAETHSAAPHSDYDAYVPGTMEIQEQQSTYHFFMGLTKWGSLGIAAAVLWLTLWFCTDAGFVVGAGAGIGLVVLGWLLLREKPAAH